MCSILFFNLKKKNFDKNHDFYGNQIKKKYKGIFFLILAQISSTSKRNKAGEQCVKWIKTANMFTNRQRHL